MNMKVGQEPFNRLVRLAARAFYDDFTTKGDNLPKTRSDNRGIAVIVLDALTRRQWVREEDLAKDLKIHMKQLRRTLRFFEEEKLIMRDHRKETAKGVKLHSAAVAATSEGHPHGKEGDDKIKLHTHSYCCLDYAQLFDVVRYRMHRMKKKLKDELESRNTIQEYICPNCSKRYTALDAARLISMEDEYFHCENCNGELVAESEKLASQDAGDGDDNARRRRREKLQELLQKLEVQLKPLVDQLNAVKDLSVPEFGTLQAWEVRASAALRAANGGLNVNDASRSGGTPMPYLEETKIEVAISDVQATEHGNKAATENTPTKVLPPWMIRQSMNLTKEQRGVVKEESKMEESTSPDDKQTANKDDAKSYQDEFLKAYYAALYQRQQEAVQNQRQDSSNEQQLDNLESSSQRQVGMKSKREDEDAEKDDDWEDGGTNTAGNIKYKVTDLNLEADPIPSDEGEDDLEWEEG